MHGFGIDCSALEVAIQTRGDVAAEVREFALHAAVQGIPLTDLYSQLESLCGTERLSYDMITAASIAWSEAWQEIALRASCVDPLTNMATISHLREHLESLYTRAEHDGGVVSESDAMLVVEAQHAFKNDLDAALAAVDIGNALRMVFVRGEVIAAPTARRFVVVADADLLNQDSLAVVAVLLRRAAGIPSPEIYVRELPAKTTDLPDLLVALSS